MASVGGSQFGAPSQAGAPSASPFSSVAPSSSTADANPSPFGNPFSAPPATTTNASPFSQLQASTPAFGASSAGSSLSNMTATPNPFSSVPAQEKATAFKNPFSSSSTPAQPPSLFSQNKPQGPSTFGQPSRSPSPFAGAPTKVNPSPFTQNGNTQKDQPAALQISQAKPNPFISNGKFRAPSDGEQPFGSDGEAAKRKKGRNSFGKGSSNLSDAETGQGAQVNGKSWTQKGGRQDGMPTSASPFANGPSGAAFGGGFGKQTTNGVPPVSRQSGPRNAKVGAGSETINIEDPFGRKVLDQLRKDRISPPALPDDPGNVANKQEMATLRESFKAYRERARSSLVKAGLIDDPDVRKKLEDAIDFKGICEDMCPDFEKVTRITEHDVTQAEKAVDTQRVDTSLMVKKLARSAAGQEAPLPMDVRSVRCLKRTIDYLIDDLLQTDDNLPIWHGFIWDRTRAIRRDFAFFSSMTSEEMQGQVYCYETIARLHVTTLHLTSRKDFAPEGFSEQQEIEQLGKTLISLMYAYNDCHSRGIVCKNEAEFRAYQLLFRANHPDIIDQVQREWDAKFWNESDTIRTAVSLVEALQNAQDFHGPLKAGPSFSAGSAFNTYFRIVEDPSVSYTMACFAEIHFVQLRRSVLEALRRGFSRPKQGPKDITPSVLNSFLRFDTDREAVDFAVLHGFEFIPSDNPEDADGRYLSVTLGNRMDYPRLKHAFSATLVEEKRGSRSLREVLHGNVYATPDSAEKSKETDDDDGLFVQQKKAPKPKSSVHGLAGGGSGLPAGPRSQKGEDPQISSKVQPDCSPPSGSAEEAKEVEAPTYSSLPEADVTENSSENSHGSCQVLPEIPQPSSPQLTRSPIWCVCNTDPEEAPAPAPEKPAPQASPFAPTGSPFSTTTTPVQWSSTPKNPFASIPLAPAAANDLKKPAFASQPTQPSSSPAFAPTTSPRDNSVFTPSAPPKTDTPASTFTFKPTPPSVFRSPRSTSLVPASAPPAPSTESPTIEVIPPTPRFPSQTAQAPSITANPFAPPPTPGLGASAPPTSFKEPPPPAPPPVAKPVPPSPFAAPSPRTKTENSGFLTDKSPKEDLLDGFNNWIVKGDHGILEHFTDFVVEELVRGTWNKHVADERERIRKEEDDKSWAEARKFRTYSLRVKFFYRWRSIAREQRQKKLRRSGRDQMRAYLEAKQTEKREHMKKEERRKRRLATEAASPRPDNVDGFRDHLKKRRVSLQAAEDALLASGVLSGVRNERQAAAKIVRSGTTTPERRRTTTLPGLMHKLKSSVSQSVAKIRPGGAKTQALREELLGSGGGNFRNSFRSTSRGSRFSTPSVASESGRSRFTNTTTLSARWRLKAMGLETMPDGSVLPDYLAYPILQGHRLDGLGSHGVTSHQEEQQQLADAAGDDNTSNDMLPPPFVTVAAAGDQRPATSDGAGMAARGHRSTASLPVINGGEPSGGTPSALKRSFGEMSDEGVPSPETRKRLHLESQRTIQKMRQFRQEMEEGAGWFKDQSERLQSEMSSQGI